MRYTIGMDQLTPPWYVLTGGPSSGKTTLLGRLEEMGYMPVPETARIFIEQELASGKTLEQIRGDKVKFQHDMLPMKIEAERNLPKDRVVFFDRGMHDTVAYLAHAGVEHSEVVSAAINNTTYRKVFLLKRFPLVADNARTETDEEAEEIERLLFKTYRESGIPTIEVPTMPIEERVQFILENTTV